MAEEGRKDRYLGGRVVKKRIWVCYKVDEPRCVDVLVEGLLRTKEQEEGPGWGRVQTGVGTAW